MKTSMLFVGLIMLAMPAFADDGQKVAERKTCADINAEIASLSAIENPDAETLANLKQLQVQQRANCMAKLGGRRTIARNLPAVAGPKATDVTTTPDALSEYLANKKSNCDKLNTEIERLATEGEDANADALASMRGVYDMDCVEHTEPAPSVVAPEKSAEEWAAEFDANLAAGLCGDGTKPNRYGCCTDETFKDVGNSVFACCPKSGGMCFPPIK